NRRHGGCASPARRPRARHSRPRTARRERRRLGGTGTRCAGGIHTGAEPARARRAAGSTAVVLPRIPGVRCRATGSPISQADRGVSAGMKPWIVPAAVVLLSACQHQARRLLLLDLALSDPALLNGTVQPWSDEGYAVEYRRFYPHLARADLGRYRVLLFLLGREPEAPSDALTAGDLALLTEWVLQGGVVVLGYDADGEGYLDRWTVNRWLEFAGTGISIGDRLLEDTTVHTATTTGRQQPWVEARTLGDEPLGSVFDPFPLDPTPGRVGARPARHARRASRAGASARSRGARAPGSDSAAWRGHDRAAPPSGPEARPRDEHPRVAATAGHAGAVDAVVRDP